MTQSISWQLCLLVVFLTYLTIVNSLPMTNGMCLIDNKLDSVCYECAKRHAGSSAYGFLYSMCCVDDGDVRDYCLAIYSEEASAGGLWL